MPEHRAEYFHVGDADTGRKKLWEAVIVYNKRVLLTSDVALRRISFMSSTTQINARSTTSIQSMGWSLHVGALGVHRRAANSAP